MTPQKKDLEFGDKKESSAIPLINKYFNSNVSKTSQYYEFDFIDTELKLLFELKSRRIEKNQFFDTMIGANKLTEGYKMINQGYKVYFLFGFTDYLSAFELTKDSINNNWFRDGGRQDRGKDEIKKYCFIPNHLLINLFSKNNSGYYIIPKMTDEQPSMSNEQPTSYSKRLIEYIQSNPLNIKNTDKYSVAKVAEMINDFSTQEYEKKKQKVNEMPFGKYKFRKVSEVANFDKQYLQWLIKQEMMNNWSDLKNEILKLI